jgi:hypothetical protein
MNDGSDQRDRGTAAFPPRGGGPTRAAISSGCESAMTGSGSAPALRSAIAASITLFQETTLPDLERG